MAVKKKFDPKFFDEEFYRSTQKDANGIGIKGAKRDENSPFYVEYTGRVMRAFKDEPIKFMLDIGGGVGYRTENYVKFGIDAITCDVSRWAYKNSIRPSGKHFCLDVRDVGSFNKKFDLVNAERILEYLPATESLKALKAIDAVAEKYIIFAIICSDHADQELVKRAEPGRLNINTKQFWEGLFEKFDWCVDQDKTDVMRAGGWDCIWVIKQKSYVPEKKV